MKHFFPICTMVLTLSTLAQAKGLKGLKPSDSTLKSKEEVESKIKENLPNKDVKKDPSLSKQKKPVPEGNAEVIADTNLAFTTIKGSKGDWSSGFTGDFRVGYRVFQMLDERIQIYASYHYLPADVIVTEKQTQYNGVVEQHLFGAAARYVLQQNLHITGQGELGLASSKFKASTSITEGSDIEESGFGLIIGGGAQWRMLEKVWIGGYLSLGTGSFQTSQLGFSTSITL